MRRLLNVRIPHAEFNAAVKDSSANQKLGRILERIRPEAVYFTERGGATGPLLWPVQQTFKGKERKT